MGCFLDCLGINRVPSNAPIEPKLKQRAFLLACSTVVALGGLFLFLAATQALPSFPNAISQLGGWGYALGIFFIASGTATFVFLCRNFIRQKKESEILPENFHPIPTKSQNVVKEEIPDPSKLNSIKLDAQTLLNELFISTEDFRKAEQHIEKAAKEKEKATKEKNCTIGPTKDSDKKMLKYADFLECIQKAGELEDKLSKIDALLNATSEQLEKLKKSDTYQSPQKLLSECIAQFLLVHNSGKCTIPSLDIFENNLTSSLQVLNKCAYTLSNVIKRVEKELVDRLERVYPDPKAGGPEEFNEFMPTPIFFLNHAWKARFPEKTI